MGHNWLVELLINETPLIPIATLISLISNGFSLRNLIILFDSPMCEYVPLQIDTISIEDDPGVFLRVLTFFGITWSYFLKVVNNELKATSVVLYVMLHSVISLEIFFIMY